MTGMTESSGRASFAGVSTSISVTSIFPLGAVTRRSGERSSLRLWTKLLGSFTIHLSSPVVTNRERCSRTVVSRSLPSATS